jgi:hypothetical protein
MQRGFFIKEAGLKLAGSRFQGLKRSLDTVGGDRTQIFAHQRCEVAKSLTLGSGELKLTEWLQPIRSGGCILGADRPDLGVLRHDTLQRLINSSHLGFDGLKPTPEDRILSLSRGAVPKAIVELPGAKRNPAQQHDEQETRSNAPILDPGGVQDELPPKFGAVALHLDGDLVAQSTSRFGSVVLATTSGRRM